MEDCIFCKIIDGKIPSAKIYEDERIFSFLDIAPANKGHCLIVPKHHSKNMLEMDEKDLNAAMQAAQRISEAVAKAFDCPAFNILMNNGKEAGQVVFHAHIHMIPRYENDGIKFAARNLEYADNEISEYAEKLKKFL